MTKLKSRCNRRVMATRFCKFPIAGLAACLMFALVSACAHRNEGLIDYRKSEVVAGSGTSAIGPAFSAILKSAQGDNTGFTVPGLNLQGEPVRLVPLARKNISSPVPDASFTDLDAVSIRLQAALINDYSEGPFSYTADAFTEGQFDSRGEVAVVVNAFQLGEEGADFDFSDEGINKGRVVYFSQDVEEGQFLNFSNMAVYGPVTYQGKPIGLDIAVMELDLSDKVTMDLLNKLASLGGKAFPAAAPGLDILNSLGETLVQKQTNDIDARYALLLDAPEGGHPDLPRATLEVGSYVFIRSEDRNKDVDWERLLLDENTGRLYLKKYVFDPEVTDEMKGSDGPDGTREFIVHQYHADNYLTFQVNKNEAAAEIDLPNYYYGTFLDEMDRRITEGNQNLTKILDPVNELVERRLQIELFDVIRTNLGTLARYKVNYDLALATEAQAKKPGETSKAESSKLEPAKVAEAARIDRVRAEGLLLRQFYETWEAFEPSLLGGNGVCPDDNTLTDGDGADPASATDRLTKLSEKQCNYVFAKFEEIAQVSDPNSLNYFRSDILIDNRRKVICQLLLGSDASTDSVCN